MILNGPKLRFSSRPRKTFSAARQVVAQSEVLVDDLDTLGARVDGLVEVLGLAVDPELAFGRREVAGDDLDQGRLAGAVVAHEAHDIAGLDREIDALQRLDGAEMLGDALELQQSHPTSLGSRSGRLFLATSRGSIHGALRG